MLRFVQYLVRFRREHRLFRPYRGPSDGRNLEGLSVTWHGVRPDQPDWGHESHSLAFSLQGPVDEGPIYISDSMHIGSDCRFACRRCLQIANGVELWTRHSTRHATFPNLDASPRSPQRPMMLNLGRQLCFWPAESLYYCYVLVLWSRDDPVQASLVASLTDAQRRDAAALRSSILNHLRYTLAKDEFTVTKRDYFQSLVFAIRDRLIDEWSETQQRYYNQDLKRVYYLSIEFLPGRLLSDSVNNLHLEAVARGAGWPWSKS